MTRIDTALHQAARRLEACSDSPRLDAEVLLCEILGRERSYLFAWPERELEAAQAAAFEALLARRAAGEPVAHITGRREFWSLPLKVTPATLIPRPETELLVELALERIPPEARWPIADLGTGSGAIALAIARERPLCRVLATDASADALAVARENARRLCLANLSFRQGHWLAPLAGERFALILSNPPYICEDDPHLQQGDVRFEPPGALRAGADGLDAIREIVAGCGQLLQPGGWLLLEHGYDQGPAVAELLEAAGLVEVATHTDLEGRARVTLGRLAG